LTLSPCTKYVLNVPCFLFRFLGSEKFAANRVYGLLKKGFLPPPQGGSSIASFRNTSATTTKNRSSQLIQWPWPMLPPFLAGQARIFTPDAIPRYRHLFSSRTVNFVIKKQLNTNFYNGHRVPDFFSSRPNWDLPHPFTRRRVCPSLVPGGTHSLGEEGVGDPSSDEGTDTVVL
jgi:hypothetical protein